MDPTTTAEARSTTGRAGAIYAVRRIALDAIAAARGGGRPVLSSVRASKEDVEHLFITATQLRSLARVDVRKWVGEFGDIRIGVGSVHGRVSTLLGLGPAANASDPALVCEIESGETVLVEGGTVEHTGRLPPSGRGVEWAGRDIATLDVNALYRWVEASVWERSALPPSRRSGAARQEGG